MAPKSGRSKTGKARSEKKKKEEKGLRFCDFYLLVLILMV